MTATYRSGITAVADLPDAAWARFRAACKESGQHLVWDGYLDHGRTPMFYAGKRSYPARHLAWVLKHGTPPEGRLYMGCDLHTCVRPEHALDDESRRREQHMLAALYGITLRGSCGADHMRTEHSYIRPDGTVDCRACDRDRTRTRRTTTR